MNRYVKITIFAMAFSCFAAGCSWQTRTERDFGDAVRTVNSNQIYDKAAGAMPSTDAVQGGDPYRLEAVVTSHHTDVSQPQQVESSMSVGVRSGKR